MFNTFNFVPFNRLDLQYIMHRAPKVMYHEDVSSTAIPFFSFNSDDLYERIYIVFLTNRLTRTTNRAAVLNNTTGAFSLFATVLGDQSPIVAGSCHPGDHKKVH